MQFLSSLRKTGKLILIVGLLGFVVLLVLSIIYLGNQNRTSPQNTALDYGLKDYAKLKNEVTGLFSNQILAQDPNFLKFTYALSAVEQQNLSEQDKYMSLVQADNYLGVAYSRTNQHALYSLPDKLRNFAKLNFPDLYKQKDFPKTGCLDTSCAQSPQPPDVLAIKDEMNASNIPDVEKTAFTQNLLNPGYMNDSKAKTLNYLLIASVFKSSGALKKAGLNEKLSSELIDYVKRTYPKEYAQLNF